MDGLPLPVEVAPPRGWHYEASSRVSALDAEIQWIPDTGADGATKTGIEKEADALKDTEKGLLNYLLGELRNVPAFTTFGDFSDYVKTLEKDDLVTIGGGRNRSVVS